MFVPSVGRSFNPWSRAWSWYDFSDLSTLFQDNAGATPVTADGDPIGMVQDKSGNARHAVQATGANKPEYDTNVQNGRSGALFGGGGTARHLDHTAAPQVDPTNWTVLCVFKTGAVDSVLYGIVTAHNSGSGGGKMQVSASNTLIGNNNPTNQDLDASTVAANTAYAGVYTASLTQNPTRFLRAATGLFTGIAGLSGGTKPFRMGALNTNNTSNFWNGHILEVMVFSPALFSGQLNYLLSYAKGKWGL